MFRVGAKVVCIDDKPLPGYLRFPANEGPVIGSIYTVRRCFIDDDGDYVLWLDEIARGESARKIWGQSIGYGAYRFRPVIDRKTDTGMAILKKLLQPKPERVE